jgi:hypothetical protein
MLLSSCMVAGVCDAAWVPGLLGAWFVLLHVWVGAWFVSCVYGYGCSSV